jgi:hypothetical protein
VTAPLLSLAPALVLAVLLLARRFPGERRLVALAQRRHGRCARPRRSTRESVGARTPLVLAPRGPALIARALAERPPPAVPSI